MEVYILDDLLRRSTVIDRFESLIWTERYSAFGDFQLVIHSTVESRSLLTKGRQLAINNSTRVMTIENVEDRDDSEGRSLLSLTGRSLESMMDNRPNRANGILAGTAPTDKWVINGTPGDIVRWIFNTILRNNTEIPADNIPFITPGGLYPAGTIAEPDQSITVELGWESTYKSIKDICDVYGLGFRLYRGPDTSKLYFEVYAGSDRTASQTTLPAVIFSPDLENLTNTAEFSSIETYKNVAYVLHPLASKVVYAPGANSNTTGFDRRVLTVDASDIEETNLTTLAGLLEKRGQDELTKHRALMALDGELPQNTKYRYGVDYELGDLIEMRNDDGATNRMRVTEQIFVDDAEGERSYPTLALDVFIQQGTWYAWDSNGVWDTAPGVWAFAGGETPEDNLFQTWVPGATYGNAELGTIDGWAGYASSTLTVTSTAANVRSGNYAYQLVTTVANGGMAQSLPRLAESPIDYYGGVLYVKTTSGHGYKVRLQEYTLAEVLIGEVVVPMTGNGAYQAVNIPYTKQQAGTILRFAVTKDAAGTFYVDDGAIWIWAD